MEIEREHPEYGAKKGMWRKYRGLYAGGEEFRVNAAEYLVKRQKEAGDVYFERLSRVFYENYIGSIIDWYAATVFRREPVVAVGGNAFFCELIEDCDRKGTALSDFYRGMLTKALVDGSSFVLVDFPRAKARPANRAEEEAAGLARAYLSVYRAADLINWERDENGNFEWVVLRTARLRQDRKVETRWSRFDRREFQTFVAEGDGKPELVDAGRHGMAGLEIVPLFELKISEGLWLMNKAALLQLEHFNKSNALAWAITMGLFAMPVIYSERDWSQIVGESYYIQLGPEDKFGWTEPEGHVYQLAADNLGRLKDEIYRVCYVLTQAGGAASSVSQSGLSKQRDFAVTEQVLRAYGDAVKDSMKRVLTGIARARQDGITVEVSGLDEFDVGEFGSELDEAEKLLGLGIASPTLKRQVFKKLAFKYLCDSRQDIKAQIAREIDEG